MQHENSSLVQHDTWQTQSRGTNQDEYDIYVTNAQALGWEVKSYDEWLSN